MKLDEINRHTLPPGGWQFVQPQTGWRAPTPTSSTFDQTVMLISKHRQANPAIRQKHKLALDRDTIANELENFTRTRLGLPYAPMPPKSPPLRVSPSVGAPVVAGADPNSIAFGILRAAQGTAVVLDWLTSGGQPVSQELANRRAAICVTGGEGGTPCSKNEAGSWYTEKPAEIIRATLEKRADLKLETPYDHLLKSCHVCRCLMRLKVWCPMEHILARTKPEIMAEFPPFCWIARKDA